MGTAFAVKKDQECFGQKEQSALDKYLVLGTGSIAFIQNSQFRTYVAVIAEGSDLQ